MKMKNEFSTWDVDKIFAIKRDRLKEWLRLGYIRPSVRRARGQGERNRFSRGDMTLIYCFAKLLDAGLDRERASVVLGFMDLGLRGELKDLPGEGDVCVAVARFSDKAGHLIGDQIGWVFRHRWGSIPPKDAIGPRNDVFDVYIVNLEALMRQAEDKLP